MATGTSVEAAVAFLNQKDWEVLPGDHEAMMAGRRTLELGLVAMMPDSLVDMATETASPPDQCSVKASHVRRQSKRDTGAWQEVNVGGNGCWQSQ